MVKLALLIGVGEYGNGLPALPAAPKDVEAMRKVLENPEIGGFDQVEPLINPERQSMEEAIYTLFANRKKDDLLLIFFSGHGVKDESGNLYLAVRNTRKQEGALVQPTAVAASFVQDVMSNSRSKRQVVILDCCFSGAFAEGMRAKDDGSVPVQQQLGGEGRAVLTSSTSTQYSYEQQGSDLSVYTRYLVEGIETGAADFNNDGAISVDELHDYAKSKVQEAAPAMKPKIYAVEEGYKIRVAQVSIGDPKLRYRKEVERYKNQGEIPFVARSVLDALREGLNLLPEEAAGIEAEVLKPYRDYQEKLQRYQQVLSEAFRRENTLTNSTRNDLKRLQQVLGLRDEDTAPIEEQFTRKPLRFFSRAYYQNNSRWLIGASVSIAIFSLIVAYPYITKLLFTPISQSRNPSPTTSPTVSESPNPAKKDKLLEGIDVSQFSGRVDWQTVKQSGISFAFIKATEGTSKIDRSFTTHWAAMKSAHIIRGAYHFFKPESDAQLQAELFLKTVKFEPGDLPPVLEVEISQNVTVANLIYGISKWLTVVEKATGRKPIIYISNIVATTNLEDLATFSDYPLWIAHYGADKPTIPASWKTWTFWQYAGDVNFKNIKGINGTVDLNRFNGSLDDLKKLALGTSQQ